MPFFAALVAQAILPAIVAVQAGLPASPLSESQQKFVNELAAKSRAALAEKSPKSLKLTLAAVRNARTLRSLEEALAVEYRLAVRLFEDGEFPEGVRALIVDKDRRPSWSPPRLEDVTEDLIARYLAPLPPAEELTFEVKTP